MAREKSQKIVIAHGEYWVGIYVDGKLQYEGHEASPKNVLAALGLECEQINCDYDWLTERGNLPENLKQVKTE